MNGFRIVKYTAYAVEIILALIWQATPYLLPEVFGGKAVLLLPLAISIAIFEPEIPSLIFAMVCGLLADCSYGGTIGFYAVTLLVFCYPISILNTHYIRKSLLTAMLEALIIIPLILILQFLFYYVFGGYSNPGYFFFHHYLARILYTLAFMPVFYGLNKLLNKRLGRS